jgi:hypothetical protein
MSAPPARSSPKTCARTGRGRSMRLIGQAVRGRCQTCAHSFRPITRSERNPLIGASCARPAARNAKGRRDRIGRWRVLRHSSRRGVNFEISLSAAFMGVGEPDNSRPASDPSDARPSFLERTRPADRRANGRSRQPSGSAQQSDNLITRLNCAPGFTAIGMTASLKVDCDEGQGAGIIVSDLGEGPSKR